MAQVPKPRRVITRSELPSCFVFMVLSPDSSARGTGEPPAKVIDYSQLIADAFGVPERTQSPIRRPYRLDIASRGFENDRPQSARVQPANVPQTFSRRSES